MLIELRVGQIWNQFWWHHLVVNCSTNTSGITYNWPNLEQMQVEFYLAGEITQVIDSIPWVRCASGNVLNPADCGVARMADLPISTVHWLGVAIGRWTLTRAWPNRTSTTFHLFGTIFSARTCFCISCLSTVTNRKLLRWPGCADEMVISWLSVGNLLWPTLAYPLSTLCLVLSRLLLFLFCFVGREAVVADHCISPAYILKWDTSVSVSDFDFEESLRLGLCGSWPPGLSTVEDMNVRSDHLDAMMMTMMTTK